MAAAPPAWNQRRPASQGYPSVTNRAAYLRFVRIHSSNAGSLSRAIRWSTSPSWELNHVDPGERTARKLLESAAHLEVSEIDGHEPESLDELRDFLLRRRVVARDKQHPPAATSVGVAREICGLQRVERL